MAAFAGTMWLLDHYLPLACTWIQWMAGHTCDAGTGFALTLRTIAGGGVGILASRLAAWLMERREDRPEQ